MTEQDPFAPARISGQVSGPRERRAIQCDACGQDNSSTARFCSACGHRLGAPYDEEQEGAADPLLGRVIAERYRIEELIGRGGMGVVYRVEHVRIGKLMAMKLLHGALARDREVVKRFKREAEAISRLDHPNTVQVFDFGESEGMMYFVMEYLAGRDLGQLVKAQGSLPLARVARIGAQVCASVEQAHELGIVHRDLKPENVMVLEDGPVADFVKVLDFGLAKLRESDGAAERSITRAGSILGTPYYMAPEHIRGDGSDARSDVYAMGALLYKALTGVPPFWASSAVAVLTMHLTEPLVRPSERAPSLGIPSEADSIVARAMEKDPRDRFQSMGELREALLQYLREVGEAAGVDTGRIVDARRATMPPGHEREVATRGDVDEFEARLRRRSLLGYGVIVLGLLVAGGLGGWLGWSWWSAPKSAERTESEPNNELGEADPLQEGVALTAYLGQRLTESRSDADVYLLENPGGERRTVRVQVSALPNMDLTFELYREGIRSPLLTADSAGIGAPEIVPNFVIDGPRYYLRVREVWESGQWPTENVSDPYQVSWHLVTVAPDEEHEVNDSIERAGQIRVGDAVRGYIGWRGDEDVYCLAGPAERVVAQLEPIASLDLILSRVHRSSARVTAFDNAGVGSPESTDVLESASDGDVCFEVSAHRSAERGNAPDDQYTLRILEAPAAP